MFSPDGRQIAFLGNEQGWKYGARTELLRVPVTGGEVVSVSPDFADELGNDGNLIPQHVQEKIQERLAVAQRRNPTLGDGHYETLAGKLEFCDLRELQDVLTAKLIWPQLEARFGSKEMLTMRFGQLAELRNRLRSRMV